MYRVMVVDDEPAALGHVCMIIEKKCPGFEVLQVAENGREALEKIEKKQPDILISDVKMPVLDGIGLVSEVKKAYPEMLSVIVSGYQDFDYAKGAIQSGVCDYLLKPLNPSDMQELLKKLESKLNVLYYEKRNALLRAMCKNVAAVKKEQVERYFPKGLYYSAIIRKNGLPKRFSGKTGVEIFSIEEERVYIYGRDEMEALYLFPEELLFKKNFWQVMESLFIKETSKDAYVTAIVNEEPFYIDQFPEVVRQLYRKLDQSVIIGRNTMAAGCGNEPPAEKRREDKECLERIEYLIRYKEGEKLLDELTHLLELWADMAPSQLYVESQIRYVFQLIKNIYPPKESCVETEFILDDIFYYASGMEDVKRGILEAVAQSLPAFKPEACDDKQQLFHSILAFLDGHLEENITLGYACKKFGVSQTSLSKMFRIYAECSFSNYLTQARIEKAKQIMKQAPETYIKDIAERVGYSDQFYFSRIFRSVVGVCPSEYLGG